MILWFLIKHSAALRGTQQSAVVVGHVIVAQTGYEYCRLASLNSGLIPWAMPPRDGDDEKATDEGPVGAKCLPALSDCSWVVAFGLQSCNLKSCWW